MNDLKRYVRLISTLGLVLLVLYVSPLSAMAQEAGALGRQTLGRPYWHVFISYAIAWVLVFGWVVSMARRLKRVEERFGKE
jgi:CcmD family protein